MDIPGLIPAMQRISTSRNGASMCGGRGVENPKVPLETIGLPGNRKARRQLCTRARLKGLERRDSRALHGFSSMGVWGSLADAPAELRVLKGKVEGKRIEVRFYLVRSCEKNHLRFVYTTV